MRATARTTCTSTWSCRRRPCSAGWRAWRCWSPRSCRIGWWRATPPSTSGVAQSCVDEAVAHCQARGLAACRRVRARIGRADAAVAAARLVVDEAARRVDRGARRRRRPTAGCGGPSCSPARPRWTWRRPCWRRPARRRIAARASAGAAVPRRPLRLAAAGHVRRVRRLARRRRARRRPGRRRRRPRDGERASADVGRRSASPIRRR